MRFERFLRTLAAAVIIAFTTAACDDNGGPEIPAGVEIGVIVNSIDLSITAFPTDSAASTRTIGLAAAGSPVSVAARGPFAVIPMGFLATAAVVDLRSDDVSTIPLPDNSGATGVAFLNDSIAYVANPNLNTVSRINLFAGTHENEIDVGIFPQAVAAIGDRVFVMNAELDMDFRPARQGGISVIDTSTDSVVAVILLTGFNPSAAVVHDGLLYVVNSGTFGMGDGSLSVVNPNTLQQIEHHTGFGEFPGDIAFDAADRAYVSSFAYGIAVWDVAADSFIRPPSDPLIIEGNAISSGLGFDSNGRLYSLIPGDCIAPGIALRTHPDLSFDRQIDAGVCPIAITFTRVESP